MQAESCWQAKAYDVCCWGEDGVEAVQIYLQWKTLRLKLTLACRSRCLHLPPEPLSTWWSRNSGLTLALTSLCIQTLGLHLLIMVSL